jgi:hypothetical protein
MPSIIPDRDRWDSTVLLLTMLRGQGHSVIENHVMTRGLVHEALTTLRQRKSFVKQPVNKRMYAVGQWICILSRQRSDHVVLRFLQTMPLDKSNTIDVVVDLSGNCRKVTLDKPFIALFPI